MQETLVLGGTGFLGAHLVAAAQARAREWATMADPTGPRVTGVGRHPGDAPRFGTPRDGAVFVAADLVGPGAAAALLDEHRPAFVVNSLAMSRPAACESDSELAHRLNTELPREVAEWCAAAGARLVHVSTDLVFGADLPPPGGFREQAPPAPISVYGRTKTEGERAVLDAHASALVVRLPLLYGNSGGRGLGASDSLLTAIDRGEKPALFLDEYRTPLEVTAAAHALVELMDTDARGILHVAGPDRVSRLELGLAVLEAMGLDRDSARAELDPTRQKDASTPDPRPADVSLNAARAAAMLETELVGVDEGTRRAAG